MKKIYALGMMAALVLALGACSKKEEAPKPQTTPAPTSTPAPTGVTVLTVTLGNAIGADKKVAQATESFGKKDTIYASVDTTGAGTATLKAKWTYRADGKVAVVKEDAQTINPTGSASSEFHVSKPDGWPAGDYQVEIFVADKAAGAKSFTVK
jgi:PBP1b-binding outer membrane lipoprotein LpoB